MSVFGGNPLLLTSAAGGAYEVSRSLRFNSGDSAYLNRTPASAGNRKTWTWSGWVKRSALGTTQNIFGVSPSSGTDSTYLVLQFNSSNQLELEYWSSKFRQTTQVFRDVSAWYHIVCAFDSTQSTAANRVKLYVNGIQLTDFGITNDPGLNTDYGVNNTSSHNIGSALPYSSSRYLDSYLADILFLDGIATDPSSFTDTDATTGQLVPKAYGGSYGTNGFRLAFDSYATTAALGTDTSGNGNTWTTNNFSVTAGSGNDSLVDTPTSFGTDTGVGNEVRGNYATWNPLDTISGNTFSNGNLDIQTVTAAYGTCRGTIGVSTGKWYWEINVLDETGGGQIGILDSVSPLPSEPYLAAKGYIYFDFGSKGNNSSQAGYGASYTTGDLIGVALDLDTGTLTFYKNGSSQGTAYSGLPSGTVFFPVIADYQSANSSKFALNAGQRPFAYTAPSGFKALCDTNLPTPVVAKPNTVMDVVLWTGSNTATARTISGLQFSPDLVWAKSRSLAYSHNLYDTVRGTGKGLYSDSTGAENTNNPYGYVSAFTSDGFTGTPGSTDNGFFNETSATYVAWCFDGGTSTVTNTAGSITSQVRANPSSGFSIITWSASGSSTQTVGHGLGVAPALIITKSRTDGTTYNDWMVYHSSLAALNNLRLNSTNAAAAFPTFGVIGAPTSSVITLTAGSSGNFNVNSGNMVAYAFSPVSGYSSFGSYVGSSDNPFVYLGFRPRWIMIKCASTDNGYTFWDINDATRSPYNTLSNTLCANLADAEDSANIGNPYIDFLSNGFKIRTGGSAKNISGQTYIYCAFAESPFQYARAR